MDTSHNLYVGVDISQSGSAIFVYPPDASGTPAPIRTIFGPQTGIVEPQGFSMDRAGEPVVDPQQSSGVSSLLFFAPTASGDVAPVRTIAGPSTGLFTAVGLASDVLGDVFVADAGGEPSIEVFGPAQSGNVSPLRRIQGSATGLSDPHELAVDATGTTYVTNIIGSSVVEFANGATGNVAPVATLSGSCTGLTRPDGITVDALGFVYVSNGTAIDTPDQILVFAPGSNGNVAPIRTIALAGLDEDSVSGPDSLLVGP